MAFEEELEKFTHNVEEAIHDAGEVFKDVKEHVLLSVRTHTYIIAFSLMALTAAILVFGTIYVWCFHHGQPQKMKKVDESKSKRSTPKSKKESRLKQPTKTKKVDAEKFDAEKVEVTQAETVEREEKKSVDPEHEEDNTVVGEVEIKEEIETAIESKEVKTESQNGDIRQRKSPENTTSTNTPPGSPTLCHESPGGNNNNSPVKSKIPVFRQKSKQS